LGWRGPCTPKDIGQVRPGQTAALRFAALKESTTPEINWRDLDGVAP
jgi:hypothetical protein